MKTYTYSELTGSELDDLARRPAIDLRGIADQVAPILDRVRDDGDKALREFTQRFDGVSPEEISRTVKSPEELDLSEEVTNAFDTAYSNIQRFHKAQYPVPVQVETMPGVICQRVPRAIGRVGLYIPGGSAILPSTTLMLGVPAQIAGCREIVIATPPAPDGTIPDEVEYIAHKVGATRIVLAGGAQAIAAMAYGTEAVPKVDKIFGPGNQYVTAAKMLLLNSDALIDIDLPAGPSEVLVIGDKSADPAFVASDLLSQAEHGADSQVVFVGIGNFDYNALQHAIDEQLDTLPRKDVAARALAESLIIRTDSAEQALDFSERYAPEHLIINTENAAGLCEQVHHAGSVFVGPWTPESVGDYASGTNHTLPTYGYARMYSGVSLTDFFRFMTVQELTEQGLRNIAPTVTTMAEVEELEAHKRAVTLRLEELKKQ